MATGYIKLDWNWQDDPKVALFRKRHGKSALVDLVQIYVLMSESGGRANLNDEATRLRACALLRKRKDAVYSFLDACAECELINVELWQGLQVVTSDRALRDGRARQNRRDIAEAASRAAAEARSEQKCSGKEKSSRFFRSNQRKK